MHGCIVNDWFDSRQHLPQKPIEIHSIISDEEISQWSVTSTKLAGVKELTDIQFLNETCGWVATDEGSLYKTMDGARTWQHINVEPLQGGRIESISFVNCSLGWIVQRNDRESRVLNTNDAGLNWHVQYSNKSAHISSVRFVNDHEGWIIGIAFNESNKPPKLSPIALHTTDQGAYWTNISANLEQAASSTNVTDIYAIEPSKAMILTEAGRVFHTEDSGQAWRQIVAMESNSDQTYFSHLG
ncbi:MAG TPA: YCF48-related protein, partial [Nitrososphaera sp.]|nr:YCF48-related protein [Nitrososphaera sp.]